MVTGGAQVHPAGAENGAQPLDGQAAPNPADPNVPNDPNAANPVNGDPNNVVNNVMGRGWNPLGGLGGLLGSFWPSQNYLKRPNISSSDEPEYIQYLRKVAESNNDTNVYITIANIYMKGQVEKGIKPNVTKAKEYYTIAAERGNGQSMYNLGVLYQDSNPEKSMYYMQK